MPRPSPSRVFSPPSRRLFPSSRLLDRRRGCRTASCRCAGGWEEALQEPLIRGGASWGCDRSRCGASMAAGSTGELHGQGLVDRGVRRRAPAAVIFLGGRRLCCMGPGRTRCTRGNSTLLLFYADSSWSCSSSMTCLIIWFGEVASIVVGWEQEPPVIGS